MVIIMTIMFVPFIKFYRDISKTGVIHRTITASQYHNFNVLCHKMNTESMVELCIDGG